MTQIDMAFVDALEREKARKQREEEQRPQPQLDDRTLPLCSKVGHHFEIGPDMRRCIFCKRVI
jgi:hypothetical protein